MEPENNTTAMPLKKRIAMAIALLAAVAAVYIVTEMALSPLTSARSAGYLLLFICAAVTVNLLFGLLRQTMAASVRGWLFTLIKWFLTLLLPLFLIPLVENMMQGRVLQAVEADLGPVVAYLHEYRSEHASVPDRLAPERFEKSAIARFVYFRKGSEYALAALVPAMDMDGETIYYDSASRGWLRVHNDLLHYYGDRDDAPDAVKRYREVQRMPSVTYTRSSEGRWTVQEASR